MIKKIIWPLLALLSIGLSLVFIVGFISSINISRADEEKLADIPNDMPEVPFEMPEGSSEILIMGDSIGFGIGDEENLGIGNRYLDLLMEEDKADMAFTNISVPGYESDELVALIERVQVKSSIASAGLIIISIGGNDLNRLDYEDNLTLNIEFNAALENYRNNLILIINEIRAVNPDAQLSIIGLYDPYNRKEPEKTRLLLEWNYQTRLIVDSDFKFAYIPTYEQFEYHLDEYLSLDQFHPSGLGYQVIAETLYSILN